MKNRFALAVLLALAALAPPARAQRPDFLTDGEIEEIREAQDPNERLKLYTKFAAERLEAVEKALAGNAPGRTETIHTSLTEYNQLLDAIDKNVDQAVTRRDLMRKGLEYALKNEPEFLKLLQSFQSRNPKDLEEYRFALSQAIDNTKDSIAGLQEVLQKQPKDRKAEKEAEKEEKKGKRD